MLKILSGHIQNNRGQVLRNIQTISETLETGNYAFPFVSPFLDSLLYLSFCVNVSIDLLLRVRIFSAQNILPQFHR